MKRRTFLQAGAAAVSTVWAGGRLRADQASPTECCERTCGSPQEAMAQPPEQLLYLPAIYAGTDVARPDYLATVDVERGSSTYGQIIHRLPMPNIGDELHHFGWNACGSCHGMPGRERRYLVLPGLVSGRIHIIDTVHPAQPRLTKVIEAEEIARKANLSAPHTVHCLADGQIMISMLGDAQKNGPGGFLLLDDAFEIVGRWEKDAAGMQFNYDFWYQPRHNAMVSSEWAAPSTVAAGFKVEDVEAGKYGQRLHFWNWRERTIAQTVDLGEEGRIPLEVRFHHDPDSSHGFVGAALSSTIWHWQQEDGAWQVEPGTQPGVYWPMLAKARGVRTVQPEDYPMLVTFADVNDPASVMLVDAANLAATFGPGYRLQSITLEITDEKVTKGEVEEVLGWINSFHDKSLDGNDIITLQAKNRLANDLGAGNFTTER